MNVKIYHNPACGTSLTVMGLLRDKGIEPEVVEYLKTPPSRDDMKKLLKDMGITPREILRRKGSLFDELNLGNPDLTDDQLLDALGQNPILMERPIVVTPKGTRVCRPSDRLQELL